MASIRQSPLEPLDSSLPSLLLPYHALSVAPTLTKLNTFLGRRPDHLAKTAMFRLISPILHKYRVLSVLPSPNLWEASTDAKETVAPALHPRHCSRSSMLEQAALQQCEPRPCFSQDPRGFVWSSQ